MMYNRFFFPRERSSSLEGHSPEKILCELYHSYLSLAYCTSSNLSAMFMEKCVPVKLSQYVLDFSLSSGSHVNLQL